MNKRVVGFSLVCSFLLVGAVYLGYISSCKASIKRYKKEIISQEKQLQWMKGAALEVALLREPHRQLGSAAEELSLSVINATASQCHLLKQIKKVQPDGKTRVWASLEKVPFRHIVQWIQVLQERGIAVTNLSADRQGNQGLVNARLTLEITD